MSVCLADGFLSLFPFPQSFRHRSEIASYMSALLAQMMGNQLENCPMIDVTFEVGQTGAVGSKKPRIINGVCNMDQNGV